MDASNRTAKVLLYWETENQGSNRSISSNKHKNDVTLWKTLLGWRKCMTKCRRSKPRVKEDTKQNRVHDNENLKKRTP